MRLYLYLLLDWKSPKLACEVMGYDKKRLYVPSNNDSFPRLHQSLHKSPFDCFVDVAYYVCDFKNVSPLERADNHLKR